MELRLRKRIKNLHKFDDGTEGSGFSVLTGYDLYYNNAYLYNDPKKEFTKTPNIYNPNAGHGYTVDTTENNGVVDYNPTATGKIHADYSQFADKFGGIAQGATSILGNTINNLSVKGGNELLAEAGSYQGNIMGVGYELQNDIDKSSELSSFNKKAGLNTLSSTASGAAAGAKFGPWGAVIGGAVGLISGVGSWIGGGHKLRKRINNMRKFATRSNIANRSGAMTLGLQNEYYANNINTLDDVLYG